MRTFIIPLIIIIVMAVGVSIANSTKISTVKDCKVLKLQQQSILSGSEGKMYTEIRYLVITDKGTFVCENSLINLKFNNSDIFFRLKEDSVYTFKVAGIGKTFITDYQNILEVNN